MCFWPLHVLLQISTHPSACATPHTQAYRLACLHICVHARIHHTHTHKESSIHKSLKYVGLKFLKKNGRENEVEMIFEEKLAKAHVRQRHKNL